MIYRNYWIYSGGLGVVWAILLTTVSLTKGVAAMPTFLVFAGFVIGWVSTTIARYVYPPPSRWRKAHSGQPD